MADVNEISPSEVAADLLVRWGLPPREGIKVVVGPASDKQQQEGVVQSAGAGLPLIEKYAPLQWHRAQMRCLHGTLDVADLIAQAVQRDLHGLVRKRARMRSTDKWYLVHLCNVVAGPSMHYDSPETWESLLFVEMLIGTQPLDLHAFGH